MIERKPILNGYKLEWASAMPSLEGIMSGYPGGIPMLPANRRLRDTRNDDVRTAGEWYVLLTKQYGVDGSRTEVDQRIKSGVLVFEEA